MLTRYSFFLVSKVANIAITDAVMGTEILQYLSVLSFYVAYAKQSVNMLNFSFKNNKFTPFYCFLSLFLSTCNFASETPVWTFVTRRDKGLSVSFVVPLPGKNENRKNFYHVLFKC